MHIFIDDSGDGGFKFESGSSSHLVMAACVFRDPKQIQFLSQKMAQCAGMHRLSTEFKYAKTKEKVKDCFFDCTADVQYSIRTIFINKRIIYSDMFRDNPNALKSFAIRQLLTHGFGTIRQAKVIIDGQDTKAFGIPDQSYLMKMANKAHPGTLSQVSWADSKQNVGIQLADMVAGAINRGIRTHKPSDTKHLRRIFYRTYQPDGTYWAFKSAPR